MKRKSVNVDECRVELDEPVDQAAECVKWHERVLDVMQRASTHGVTFSVDSAGVVVSHKDFATSAPVVRFPFKYNGSWDAESALREAKMNVDELDERRETARRVQALRSAARAKLSDEEYRALTGLDGAYD